MQADAGHAREAALALHALPEGQRLQVLQRLSAEQRARVEPLLAELAELGLPPSLARRTLAQAEARADAPQDRLARLPADAVAAALATQGRATVVLTLAAFADAPWQAEVQARLAPELRSAVEHGLRSPPQIAPAARQALAEEALAAAQRQAEAGRLAGPGWWQKVRAWMR